MDPSTSDTTPRDTAGTLPAAIVANLPLPAAWIVGNLVGGFLKSTNPDNVDITHGLAYLRPILVSAFATMAVVAVLALVLAMRRRRAGDTLPLNLLVVHVIVAAVVLATQSFAESAAG